MNNYNFNLSDDPDIQYTQLNQEQRRLYWQRKAMRIGLGCVLPSVIVIGLFLCLISTCSGAIH